MECLSGTVNLEELVRGSSGGGIKSVPKSRGLIGRGGSGHGQACEPAAATHRLQGTACSSSSDTMALV